MSNLVSYAVNCECSTSLHTVHYSNLQTKELILKPLKIYFTRKFSVIFPLNAKKNTLGLVH